MRYIFILVVLFLVGCNDAYVRNMGRVPDTEWQLARDKNVGVLVDGIKASRPNSAGGVDVSARILNTSNRTIKYVALEFIPFNAVGDVVFSEVGNKLTGRLRMTGPLTTFENKTYRLDETYHKNALWSNVWWNHSIRCIRLTSVKVTWMDGSMAEYDPEQVLTVRSHTDSPCQINRTNR